MMLNISCWWAAYYFNNSSSTDSDGCNLACVNCELRPQRVNFLQLKNLTAFNFQGSVPISFNVITQSIGIYTNS
ncbi:hypothetical protein IC582_008018 [Cucumis melo]